MSSRDTLYAAHYDLEGYSDHGAILSFGNDGSILSKFVLPNGPEISSIMISRYYIFRHQNDTIYCVEQSTEQLYKLRVKLDS